MPTMTSDQGGIPIPAFPLKKGQIGITTGTISNCKMANCSTDGTLTLVSYGESVGMVAGDVYTFDTQDVTVESGSFNLA